MKTPIQDDKKVDEVYMSIDHLKVGSYVLKILNKNKVIKSIKFQKI
ncbi:hypothetical protein H4O20_07530 [Aequorivita sp. 609]|nr:MULTISPECIES: hypothetical protein [Aequorivita]MBB6681291.1 hypothetical protein [Aequorivita sp. 609]